MRKQGDWWIGEYWCKPPGTESAALCHIRYWARAIFRLFRPALMALAWWAIVPNVHATVGNGYGPEIPVDAWVL